MSVKIKTLRTEHVLQAIGLLSNAFLHRKEPTCYHLQNKSEDAFRYQTLCYLNETCKTGLSFVAVDTDDNNKVVGVCLNRDYTYKVPKDSKYTFSKIAAKNNQSDYFKMMIEEAKDIDKPFVDAIRNDKQQQISLNYLSGDVFYIYMVGVHKDYQRKGIITDLVKYSVDKGKKLNYKICYFQASNEWSKRCFVRNNFKIINKMDYKTWEYPKGSNKYPKAFIVGETGFASIYTLIFPLKKDLKLSFEKRAKL